MDPTHYSIVFSKSFQNLKIHSFTPFKDNPLYVDWTHVPIHPLIFDIHLRNPHQNHTVPLLLHYFQHIFLPVLEKYVCLPTLAILLAVRRPCPSGMHLHLLNLHVSHDDYTHLCGLMELECRYEASDCIITLECPSTLFLVASDTPLYSPTHLFQVKPTFCKISLPEHSFDLMMPFPQKEGQTVAFSTRILPRESSYEKAVAHFKSGINLRDYVLVKDLPLAPGPASWCFSFFQNQSRFLQSLSSPRHRVFSTWYERFSPRSEDTGIFEPFDQYLIQRCPHLKHVSSPLRHILASPELCLPVYFALCNEMQNCYDPETIADHLMQIQPDFRSLVKPPPAESSQLTLETMVYCAFKCSQDLPLLEMGRGWDWILEATQTFSELKQHLCGIQQRFFPIVKGSNQLYSWDPLIDQWVELEDVQHMETVLQFILRCMMYFEGFEKLPLFLQRKIQKPLDWIESWVKAIENDLEDSETIVFHSFPRTTLADYYGLNVPEYYFFDESLEKRLQRMNVSGS